MCHFGREVLGFRADVGSSVTPEWNRIQHNSRIQRCRVCRSAKPHYTVASRKAHAEAVAIGRSDLRSPEVRETESPQSAVALEYGMIGGGLGESMRFVKPHCDTNVGASPVRSYVGRDTNAHSPHSWRCSFTSIYALSCTYSRALLVDITLPSYAFVMHDESA